MIKVKIKPLSVNNSWCGRRYKTPAYKAFCNQVPYLLPSLLIPEGELLIILEFGFSSRGSDWDNCIKGFQDILSKKYRFNDNRIYTAIVFKEIVKVGEEYIKYRIVKKSPTVKKELLNLFPK